MNNTFDSKKKKFKTINNKQLIFIILVVIFAIYFVINLAITVVNFSFHMDIKGFLWTFDNEVKKEQEHTNILIAGIGGENHEGSNLTDTLIFTSYNHTTKSVFMVSIPRDMFYKDDIYANKINEIYAISILNQSQNPTKDIETAVSNITGKSIHYYVIVDFNGFKELINTIGGITIDVDPPFTDNMYPTNDYKWKTISFKAGPQIMSGERALEYVRSRHAKGSAGSDFARSKRQQQIIKAIYEQLKNTNLITDPTMIKDLFDIFTKYIKTDIILPEMIAFAKIALDFDISKVEMITLTDSPYGFLYTPSKDILQSVYNGMYVLLPIEKNFKQIQTLTDIYYNYGDILSLSGGSIAMVNTTKTQNLANECSELMKKYGFSIIKPLNTTEKINLNQSYIYNINPSDSSNKIIPAIQKLMNMPLNDIATEIPATEADILIFLGKDAQKMCEAL